MVMSDMMDKTLSDDDVMRLCELRLADAQKTLSRASAQVASISQLAVTRSPPQLSRLGCSLFEKKKKIKKCACGGIVEAEAVQCGECEKKQLAAAQAAAAAVEAKVACWVMVKDSAGRVYYWNQTDDTTSWVAPQDFVPPTVMPSTPVASPSSKNHSNNNHNANNLSSPTATAAASANSSPSSVVYSEDVRDKDDGNVQEEFESEYDEEEEQNNSSRNHNNITDDDMEFSDLSIQDKHDHSNSHSRNNSSQHMHSPTIENKNQHSFSASASSSSASSSSSSPDSIASKSSVGRRRHSKIAEEAVLAEGSLNSGETKASSWKEAYKMVGLMGLGAFGSVHLIEHRTSNSVMALKAINLFHLNEKQKRLSEAQLVNERLAFSRIDDHNFLLSCHQVIEEDNVTFLLLEACLGGDLSFMMNQGRRFDERAAQFYGACLILALGHLHSKNVVHCDVKPENILLNSRGYPKLCDYGNSKDLTHGDVLTDLGTIEYCAPEIVERKPHGTAVDIWALAVFLCELATGICPFAAGTSRAITVRRIVTDPIVLPTTCSPDLASLLRGMLARDPATRADLSAVKNHRWFAGLDWAALKKKQLPAPIVPVVASNKDLSNFVVMDHVGCSVCRGFGVSS